MFYEYLLPRLWAVLARMPQLFYFLFNLKCALWFTPFHFSPFHAQQDNVLLVFLALTTDFYLKLQ